MRMSSSFLSSAQIQCLETSFLMHVPFDCHPRQLISSVSIISSSLQKFFIQDHHLEGYNYETPESTAAAANHCHLAEGVSLSKRVRNIFEAHPQLAVIYLPEKEELLNRVED